MPFMVMVICESTLVKEEKTVNSIKNPITRTL